MLATLFIVGGIWFWILSVAAIALLLWEVHFDRPIAGLITVGLYLGLIHLFGDASVHQTIQSSPWVLYLGIPGYFLVGVVWGLVKWFLYVNRQAIEYKQSRKSFLLSNSQYPTLLGVNITEETLVPDELKAKWRSYHKKPNARRNKWKIITWMCYWPLSMIWSVLDEPWRYIYEALSNSFQKVSDKIYNRAGYDQDMDMTKAIRDEEATVFPGNEY